MGQAEELLNSLASGDSYSVSGEYVVIGEDRFMVVPENFKKLGVQFDHDVNTISFICPRYSDGRDMSTMSVWVNYMRADGYVDAARCENVTVDTDDANLMHFDWVVTRNATEINGELKALVCVKKVDSSGNEQNHWNSEICSDFYVSEGMEAEETAIEMHADVVEHLLLRMTTVENKTTKSAMLNYVKQYLTAEPSVIINHINSLIAEEPIQEFVNEYLDEYVDIGVTENGIMKGSVPDAFYMTELVGKTEQKRLEGKNLCDFGTKEVNGYGNFTLAKPLPPGTYTFSTLVTSTDTNASYSLFAILDESNNITNFTVTRDERASKTFTTTTEIVKIRLCSGPNTTESEGDTSVWKDIQIEVGETATEYEPYCGGIPSPNPYYPQVLENSVECVKMQQGYYLTTNELPVDSALSIRCRGRIPCKAGDLIKVDLENARIIKFVFYNGTTFVSGDTTMTEYGYSHSVIVPAGVNNFTFYITGNEQITPDAIGKITPTVNGKYIMQIVESGKNILNLNDSVNGFVNSSLAQVVSGPGYKLSVIYPIGAYVMSRSSQSTATYWYCIYFDADKNIIKRSVLSTFSSKIDQSVAGAKYFRICYTTGGDSGSSFDYDIQLEEGTEATPYEPYTEKVTTILLDEPLREGDSIKRKDGVVGVNHKRVNKLFNGLTDTWALLEGHEHIFEITPIGKLQDSAIVCDSYTVVTSVSELELVDYGIYCESAIIIKDKDCTTADEFNTKLQSNPITIEYELEEEIFTPLDLESQRALNSLVAFDSMTYVKLDSKIPASAIKGEYGTSRVGARTLRTLLNTETLLLIHDASETSVIDEPVVPVEPATTEPEPTEPTE